MIKPYYERGGITIYHGDCREVMPILPRFDLMLTDPPYGIGSWSANHTGGFMSAAEALAVRDWDVAPDGETLRALVEMATYSIVWGGNYLIDALGRTRSPLIWNKVRRGMHFADGEFAWTNFDFGTLRILDFALSSGETKGPGRRVHPTQKPLDVMCWSIRQAPALTRSILDPFMGSGTTLRAAKDMGRNATGIELDERYCEIAAKRLEQEVLPLEATA
jgi:site-specific DNA-methyltransferase (adenine-specific)